MFTGTPRYQSMTLLGRGSMGVVYRVHDAALGSDVALKTLDELGPERVYHLKQEFRSLTAATHPNLVELHELVVTDQHCFFTMELVDGRPFVEHVRGSLGIATAEVPDLARLHGAARQLILGVSALHAAGQLHRDVKPSNVLVTRTGRVVLLDFGLATGFESQVASEAMLAGTFPYMAPEQIWGNGLHPAADWYSVGILLYEALTGQLPFGGTTLAMLRAKEKGDFDPPAAVARRVPQRLDSLICDLLHPDAARRPGAQEILQRLDGSPRRRAALRWRLAEHPVATPFVGRVLELASLHAALDAVRPGEPVLVQIEGASGIGKTELAHRFLWAAEHERNALVLRGRCHPHESIPYKALDSLVDGLSRFLLTVPVETLRALAPPHTGALVRLFPALARVPALAGPGDEGGEPHDVRQRGAESLRMLCANLAANRPVVLWIDDAQWGDLDSAVVLQTLLRPPLPPGILLLLSFRHVDGQYPPFVAALQDDPAPAPHAHIVLGPLTLAEARQLAAVLGPPARGSAPDLSEIAAESEGSPFFIGELTRALMNGSARSGVSGAPGSLRLADVMAARVTALPTRARRILEIAAVGGGPLERRLVLEAAGAAEGERPLLAALRRASLLRSTTVNEQPGIEVFHDRIREVIVARLPAGERMAHHRALATALERRPERDPEALFLHWRGAGEAARAGHYAVAAADRASAALAFDRAATLYAQALALVVEPSDRWRLQTRLAEALANAGRGSEAAPEFEAAANALATVDRRHGGIVSLRRRAAEQYLRSGHLASGLAAARAVLASVGITMPRSPRGTLASALLQRVRLEWRGFRFRARSADQVSPQTLLRLDACWGAAIALSVVDQTLCDALSVRHLLEALACGERSRVGHALGYEAAREAALGGRFLRRRSVRHLRTVTRLASETGEPYDRAWLHLALGTSAYLRANWRRARRHCEAAIALWRAHCTGVAWEIVTAESFGLSALAHMGALRELAGRLPVVVRDADARGDLYGAISFRTGVLGMHRLAEDEPERALREAEEAIARWPTPVFHVQHYLHLLATVQADLYLGDSVAAWRRVGIAWPKLRRALFLHMEAVGAELHHLRARAALAEVVRTGDQRLLGLAAAEARRIGRRRVRSAQPFAAAILAGVACCEGRTADAVAGLERAAAGFVRADMGLYAAAARYCSGLLRGDESGHRAAEDRLRAEGVTNPHAMVAMLMPGCGTYSRADHRVSLDRARC